MKLPGAANGCQRQLQQRQSQQLCAVCLRSKRPTSMRLVATVLMPRRLPQTSLTP